MISEITIYENQGFEKKPGFFLYPERAAEWSQRIYPLGTASQIFRLKGRQNAHTGASTRPSAPSGREVGNVPRSRG